MTRYLFLFCVLSCWCRLAAAEILMVADEIPAMEVLAKKLKAGTGYTSQIVTQKQMPSELAPFKVVMVYIHGSLATTAEDAFIQYANAGGKLILLHHSISSGKRRNPHWFTFIGISLPEGDVDQGGYKWIEPATLELVNLAPSHYITTQQVKYETTATYRSEAAGKEEKTLPSIVFEDSEVYLNHTFKEPRTILMGLKYTDAKTGKTYMQDRAAWYRKTGTGWLMYFMPGHTARDFENTAYAQILVNAVQFQP